MCTQNLPKNQYFLAPDTHKYGKLSVRKEWMIPGASLKILLKQYYFHFNTSQSLMQCTKNMYYVLKIYVLKIPFKIFLRHISPDIQFPAI